MICTGELPVVFCPVLWDQYQNEQQGCMNQCPEKCSMVIYGLWALPDDGHDRMWRGHFYHDKLIRPPAPGICSARMKVSQVFGKLLFILLTWL